MTLRLRVRLQRSHPHAMENTAFRARASVRVPRITTLLTSVAIHIVVIALVAVLSRQTVLYFNDAEIDWSRYHVEPLRLHLAQPLYFRVSEPEKRSFRALRQPGKPAKIAARATTSRLLLRGLELPKPPEIAKNAVVIVQPDFRPSRTLPDTLPPLAFWARQSAELMNSSTKQVVIPGRTEEPSAAAKLAATPVAAVPNREQAVANVNISLPEYRVQSPPALPVTNSATVPVRTRQSDTNAASLESLPGQPTHVLAFGTEHVRHVEIPRGIQNIPTFSDADPDGETHRERNAPRSGGGAPDPAGSTASEPAAFDHPARNSVFANYTEAANVTPLPSTEAETRSGSFSVARAYPSAHSASVSETTRIDHPANGAFDIVIMQSASSEETSGSTGMLSGNPIYSVYLRVGDQKEWLLEYCVAADQRQGSNPYQLFVQDAFPVTPPYPLSTTIPNSILGQPISRQIVLHGILTASGSFRNMKAPDPTNTVAANILPFLNDWQFRPAVRNKSPIDIEVVLVIPPRS